MESLTSKLVKVMHEVKYIQKTGYNSFHKYKYATEADVTEAVREQLAKLNVFMLPSVKSIASRPHTTSKGNVESIVTVEVEFTFLDAESGESKTFCMVGEGQDAGDKGVYKAITGCQKYALMKAFMIPTGDDPEGDTSVDERNTKDDNRIHQDKNGYYNMRDLWVELGGKEEAFDNWHKIQYDKGVTNKQMMELLERKGKNEQSNS